MNKENSAYGFGGLVLGVLLMLFLAPTFGNMSWGKRDNAYLMGGQAMHVGMMGGGTGSGMMGGSGMMMGGSTAGMMGADDIDKAFIEEMIPHHQMAVMMAEMLKGRTDRPEMKKLADDIIKAQNAEIEMMRGWYEDWYGKN